MVAHSQLFFFYFTTEVAKLMCDKKQYWLWVYFVCFSDALHFKSHRTAVQVWNKCRIKMINEWIKLKIFKILRCSDDKFYIGFNWFHKTKMHMFLNLERNNTRDSVFTIKTNVYVIIISYGRHGLMRRVHMPSLKINQHG